MLSSENPSLSSRHDGEFDDLMADLFVLITHHSLTQCDEVIPKIVARIQQLVHHADIECYPKQLTVLLKMRRLWRTKQFRREITRTLH